MMLWPFSTHNGVTLVPYKLSDKLFSAFGGVWYEKVLYTTSIEPMEWSGIIYLILRSYEIRRSAETV
jgi:hypothetical protein